MVSEKGGEGRDWSFFQLKLSNSQPEIENGVAYKKKNVYKKEAHICNGCPAVVWFSINFRLRVIIYRDNIVH